MAISSPGIGSGLDINGIITKLMQVEQQPLAKLDVREASYQSKISAFGSLKGAVSSLNTALASLVPSTSTSTRSIKASIANTSAAMVTANNDATEAEHALEIKQLATANKVATVAQSQKLASGVLANALSTVSQGTFSIRVGSGNATNVVINAGNATLTGLKNAINAAGTGVTADIIPDAGGVRLVLTSNTIGAAGEISTSGIAGFNTADLSDDPDDGGRVASGYASASDSIATGTLNIQVGSGAATNITIDNSNNTLAGLKNAINASGAGVTAELVTVGNNNVRLVLTAKSTGEDNVITTSNLAGFDFDGNTGTGSLSQSAANGGQIAQDAIIKVDGVTSSHSSNTITSAISNVTLRLTATTSSATTITVKRSEGTSFAEQASAKFRSYKGTVGDGSASVVATSSAATGSYAFQVMQLATTQRITTPAPQSHTLVTAGPQAQVLRSGTFGATTNDVTNGIDNGALQIAIGNNPAFTVDVNANTTLSELADLINNDAENMGVNASVVADGANYRLQLTSNVAGASGKLTITNGGGLSGFDYDSSNGTGSLSESQSASGYSSSADTISQGTLSVQVGGGVAVNVTVNGSNNTLAGLRDAINNSGAGVTASIEADGIGVRLKLVSNTLGRNGALTLSGLDGFAFNTMTENLSDDAADGGMVAQGYTSAGATVGTGTLSLTLGDGTVHTITIDSSNNTLEGVKNVINGGPYDVTATLVSTGDTDVRLVLTSNKIGVGGRITLSGVDGLEFDPESGTGDFSQATSDGGQSAQGSIIKLNGVTINGDSNTLTDVLQGVTLNLTSVSTTASTLTISQDKTSSLSATLSSIIKAYNDLNKSIADLGKYDSATKSGGPLLGNSTLRQVSNSIRSAFSAVPAGLASNTIRRLSDIGIEVQRDGTLTFNSGKLSSATSSDYDAVALLAASFGKAAKAVTDGMLGTKGTITSASSGMEASINSIEQQREFMSRRLVQIEARYKRQFSSLDTLVASMNQTSSYLTQQLSRLPGASSSNN